MSRQRPDPTANDSSLRRSITNLDANLEMNRTRWGNPENWSERDQYGYRWDGSVQQTSGSNARFADRFLRPYLDGRYDFRVLELSPGGGRFTAELIRYASSLDLLDMNQACLDICMERFKYFPIELNTFVNDGRSCAMLSGRDYELIASFDSMVHMHPDIIEGYINQLGALLVDGGIMWLDHSGKGAREIGHRTEMTDNLITAIGNRAGLTLVDQKFRNEHDCITVFTKTG